ncbi:MAG: AcrB/AcrD/AcrF family protein, partial [Alphaproteobacteria bacterium]|nr:AcrB/AcrD/AcrF family protein [Alphaproteobacteria bacterium]
LAGVFVDFFPQCLGRPEQVSDEVYRIWLSNVREAKPLLIQPVMTLWSTIALPIAGLTGTLFAAKKARGTPVFVPWLTITLFTMAAFALTLWQVRMGPATQLVAIPGAVALAWALVPRAQASGQMLVRVFGTFAIFLFVSGIGISAAAALWQTRHETIRSTKVSIYGRGAAPNPNIACLTLPVLTPLNRLPGSTIFTHVDLSARLLLFTHHRAISGPYHRNGDAILDVYHDFGGTPEQARVIMAHYGARYLLICPGMNETTVYHARWPGGFYDQLIHGKVPDWLTPVTLPRNSPLKLWAIAQR